MLFGDVRDDIEEFGRLDLTLRIYVCQQFPLTGPDDCHSLSWARKNQTIDWAFYRIGFRIGKQSDKASSIEFFREITFPASQLMKGR